MNDPKNASWTWMLVLALACALIVPVSVAEEAKEETKEAEKAEPEKAELRVEEGRTMTNRQAPATVGAAGKKKKKVDIPEGQVFTNALLDQLFGPSEEGDDAAAAETPAAATPGAEKTAPDPLKAMQDGIAERTQRQRMIADAQKEVEAAKAKLAKLEVQLRATSNPFSARPELTDEEKQLRANSDESAAERNERTKKLVEEARAEVKAAQEKLAALQSGS